MARKETVIITGVSSGIGLATAKLFTKEGWRVLGVGKDSCPKGSFISEYFKVNLSNIREVSEFVEEITSREKYLNALINNAAMQVCKPLVETTQEEWDEVFGTNVRAPFLLAKDFFNLLGKAKGSIVNVASVHAQATSLNIAAYAASKGALMTLTRNMALEFASQHIRVNAVLPGAVDTAMLRAGLKRGHIHGENIQALVNNLGKKHLLQRVGRPEEIAQAIYFLCDPQKSSFITGQSLIVDGGALAKLSTE